MKQFTKKGDAIFNRILKYGDFLLYLKSLRLEIAAPEKSAIGNRCTRKDCDWKSLHPERERLEIVAPGNCCSRNKNSGQNYIMC